jgi:hypothetical protein
MEKVFVYAILRGFKILLRQPLFFVKKIKKKFSCGNKKWITPPLNG